MEPGQQCSCDCRQWEYAGRPLYLSHASPTCSAGPTPQSGLGLRVWGLRAPQSSGFQRDFVVGLRPLPEHFGAPDCICWSLLVAPRRGLLRSYWQLLPRSRKRGDLRELHGLWSFGCIREPFGQRRIREPFGQRRVGEVKASFLAMGTLGQSLEGGGCQAGMT